ncbi:AAA family ATPase [Mucilaginibacter sp. E4BP6]|jgi:MoxR-like ATPase|uniref:AAA family ATPase n=1 Tax=Mucilaginibacter sp. E4BP6 TaxID=2723089 RepID=UPI0015CE0201|nr:MoxR family ATPase [Mucilaginibacter sp. E4BP6]NYE68089.1 MoxR-like ATPase [Mucilaginibacter sp. E4BP6]
MQYPSDVEAADALNKAYKQLRAEIGKVIIGQDEVVKFVLISIFSNGHCLLVGVPGLAKTLLVQTVAQVLDLDFKRIQFTPDLMPSDIIGSEILGEDRNFKFIPGPVFSNIILADEINRTPPKTQAALLEAMQEKAVTAAGVTHQLSKPFFVLATQNPIEQEGTYPLPEAQLDRFMFNVSLDYPSFAEELQVVKNTTSSNQAKVNHILNAEQIIYFQQLVRNIPVADNVLEYAVKLVAKTRPNGEFAAPQVKRLLNWGAGPRASQYLILGAKCHAVLNGKYSPDIEDVQAIAKPILRHRIVRSYHAEADGLSTDDIIEGLF